MDRKFKKRIIKQVQTGLLALALVITQVAPVGLLPATALAEGSAPSQIAFTTGSEKTGAVDEKVNFQVQAQDDTGTGSNVAGTTRLYLDDNSDTGVFYDGTIGGECNTDTPVESVSISSNGLNKAFCYSNSQDGEYTLSVEAKDSDDESLGWEIVSAMVTVGTGAGTEESTEVCVVENTTQDTCHEDLKTAVADSAEADRLQLNENTAVNEQARLKPGMTLDGQGFILSSPFVKTSNSNNSALYVANNVTIQNLILDGSEGSELHGINTYKHENVLVENVTLKNYRSGLVVNGSEVTVRNINTSGNAWHGINVDQGSGVSNPAVLTVEGTSSHTDIAPIYLDKAATADVTVNDINSQYDSTDNVSKEGDRLYTLKAPDTTKPVLSLLTSLQEFYKIRDLSLEFKATDEQSGIGQFTANIRKNGDQFKSCINKNGEGALEVFGGCDLANLEDALYQIRSNARDLSGNMSQTLVEEFVVDTVAPQVTNVVYLRDGVETKNFQSGDEMTVRIVVEDENEVNKIQYWARKYPFTNNDQLTSGNLSEVSEGIWETTITVPETYSNGNPLNQQKDGNYLNFRPYDVAGNSQIQARTNFTIDNTRPEVQITSEIEEYYKDGTVVVEVTATDGQSGVGKLVANIRKNGSHLRPCINQNGEGSSEFVYTCTLEVSELEDATYQIRTNARDLAGNMSQTMTQEFGVDTVQPNLTITSPTTNSYTSADTINVEGMVSDDMSGVDRVELRVNKLSGLGGSFAGTTLGSTLLEVSETGEYSYDVSDLDDGAYRFQVRAYDKAENRRIQYVDVLVDTAAPIATIISPENEEMLKGMISLAGEVEDMNPENSHWEIRDADNNRVAVNTKKDGRTTHTFEWDSTTVEDGIYTVYFETRDKIGNKDGSKTSAGDSVAMIEITIKNTAPEAPELITPDDEAVVNGSLLTNSWSSVTDAVKYVYQSFNDSETASLRWEEMTTNISKSASNVAESVFWWRVKAVDQVENESEWSELRKVTIDNTAPSISFQKIIDGTTVTGDVHTRSRIVNETGEVNRVTYLNDEVILEETNTSRNSEIKFDSTQHPDGAYTIKVVATDKAGNTSEASQDFVIDNSISAIVSDTEEVSILKAALEESGLSETFLNNQEDTYTVFAPTDEAFTSLLSELEISADELLAREDLAEILTYHVVPGTVLSTDLVDGQPITTLSGKKLFVLFEDGKVYLEDENGGKVEIITPDIKASNGVIHLIGEVLLPNDEISDVAEIDGEAVEDEEDTFRPGTTVTESEDISVEITKEGEEAFDYNQETGLVEEGIYTITSTDRFGRTSSRTIVIEAAEVPVVNTPEGQGGSNIPDNQQTDAEQPTQLSPEPESQQNSVDQGGTNDDNATSSDNTNSAEDNDLSPIAFEAGSSTDVTGNTPEPIIPGNTAIIEDSQSESGTDESTEEESETDGLTIEESDDSEEEDTGLAANIGDFIGGWFSTWWGWLISIAVLIFLIFLIIRRKEEE